MAPRARLPKNRLLVPNLYEQRGYYTYRNPITGEWYGLGRDKGKALTQAIEANLHLRGQAVTLLDRITGRAGRTVNDWCDEYGHHARMKWLRDGLGDKILEKLTPLEISEWLDRWNGKPRMRQAMLSAAKVVLGAAIGKGWITNNPAAELTTPTPKTMRARLTLATYLAIHTTAHPVLQRAMELALMTCARRENVLGLQRADIRDGHLHIEHIKDGLKVRYPLSLHLASVGWTLGDVIGRCRSATVSKFLLHHATHAGQAKPGDPWRDKTLEAMFRTARESAGVTGAHPPTFHEIRSLAIRLWDAAGYDAKKMAGHKTDQSSALYKDSRGAEWATVATPF